MLSVTQEEEEGCQGDAGEPGGQGHSPPDSWHTSNVILPSGGRRSYGGPQQSKGAPPPVNMVEKGKQRGHNSRRMAARRDISHTLPPINFC